VTPDECVEEGLPQLADGRAEVLIGVSIGSRREGEALFDRINP
jgi:uncharacterized oxidoreductase